MTNAITTLSATVNPSALWGEFANAVPFIGGVVLFAFGYGLIKKLVKGTSRGKARM